MLVARNVIFLFDQFNKAFASIQKDCRPVQRERITGGKFLLQAMLSWPDQP
jgi:hypothetical protein